MNENNGLSTYKLNYDKLVKYSKKLRNLLREFYLTQKMDYEELEELRVDQAHPLIDGEKGDFSEMKILLKDQTKPNYMSRNAMLFKISE